jgi:hypothetical protein
VISPPNAASSKLKRNATCLGSSQKQTNLVLFSGSRDLERVLYGKKQQNLQNVTMNISLTSSLEQWLQKKVASGRYQTSSECAAVG